MYLVVYYVKYEGACVKRFDTLEAAQAEFAAREADLSKDDLYEVELFAAEAVATAKA